MSELIHFSYYGGTGRTFCGAEVDASEQTEQLDKMTCMKCYETARRKWALPVPTDELYRSAGHG